MLTYDDAMALFAGLTGRQVRELVRTRIQSCQARGLYDQLVAGVSHDALLVISARELLRTQRGSRDEQAPDAPIAIAERVLGNVPKLS
jgi:hypothetical protein